MAIGTVPDVGMHLKVEPNGGENPDPVVIVNSTDSPVLAEMVVFTPAVTVVLAVVPVALALAAVAWRRRDEPAGKPVVVYLVALAAGATAYGAELGTADLRTKVLLVGVSFVLMSVFVGAWFWVALAYTGRSRFTTRRTAALLAVEPVIVATAAALPPLRSAIYELPASGGVGSMGSIGAEAGVLVVTHFVYLLVLMFGATALFVQLFVRARHLYRLQATALLAAAFAPWLAIIVPTFDLFTGFDVTLFAWVLAGIAITAALFRVKVLDPVPAAHASIVEEMGDGVVVLDEDDRVGDTNPEARRLLGIDDDAIGTPIADVFGAWETVDRDDPDAWHEIEIERDDRTRHLETQVSPFFDHHDRPVGRLLVLRDITERKHREQSLARYKTVFESVQDQVFALDNGGRFVLANDPLGALLGVDADSLVGSHVSTMLAEDDERFAGGGAPDHDEPVEVAIETAEGETIPCELQLAPVVLRDVEGTVGAVRDIRRRKRVERSLQETTERFETLVAASPLAIVAVDADATVEVWNPAAEELFGWSAEAIVGEELPIIPDEHTERLGDQHKRVLAGERLTGFETTLRRKDGSRVEVRVSIAPVHDAGGEIYGSVSVIADITERKRREREIRRQNERLDEFASVVSHDLRTPLSVVSGRLELAAETGDMEHVEHAEDALARMEEFIEDILTLAREGKTIGETEPVDFTATILAAWNGVPADTTTLDVEPGVPETIESDRGRLAELFENLFRNAVEHGSTSPPSQAQEDAAEHDSTSPRSGTREDAVEHGSTNPPSQAQEDAVEHGGAGVTVTVGPTPEGFYVADDGPGIPADKRAMVFDSGYTTAAEGTGFGLAIVERIAEAHGWTVAAVESETGGARFEFAGVTRTEPPEPTAED